jgi:fucose 4-O-acetylase-like acetyltransferase
LFTYELYYARHRTHREDCAAEAMLWQSRSVHQAGAIQMELKKRDWAGASPSPETTTPKPRLAMIDIAKGLGILLIVLGHNRIFANNEVGYADFLRSFRLPFFFFVSGVTFSIANRSWQQLAVARADAWLKPFAMAVLISGALKILVGKAAIESVLLGLLFGAGFTLIWTAIWFLPHLWLLYVSTAALLMYGKQLVDTWPKRAVFLITLSTIGYFFIDSFNTVREDPSCRLKTHFDWSVFDCGLPFSADLLPLTMSFFLLGHFLSARVKVFRTEWVWALVCAGALLSLHLSFGYRIDLNMRRYDSLLISTAQALCGIYVMLCVCALLARIQAATRLISYLGRGSLFILLFHMPIQYRITDTLILKMGPAWLVGVIGFVIAILVPLLFWELCKRSRILSALFLPTKRLASQSINVDRTMPGKAVR